MSRDVQRRQASYYLQDAVKYNCSRVGAFCLVYQGQLPSDANYGQCSFVLPHFVVAFKVIFLFIAFCLFGVCAHCSRGLIVFPNCLCASVVFQDGYECRIHLFRRPRVTQKNRYDRTGALFGVANPGVGPVQRDVFGRAILR